MFFRILKTLFELAYDFKIPHDLTLQTTTNTEYMMKGGLVGEHITFVAKKFGVSTREGAEVVY